MNKLKYSNNSSELSKQTWILYEKSFSEEEKRPFNMYLKAIEDNRFFPYIYTSKQKELLALCFYWDFINFKYLEYLAVNPKYRSKGIGSQIIKELVVSEQPVILEIEPPIDKISKKRLMFYENNNFKQTGYSFKQLKYKKNNNDIFLDLLCNKPMNNNLFELFKNTIYKELTIYCER